MLPKKRNKLSQSDAAAKAAEAGKWPLPVNGSYLPQKYEAMRRQGYPPMSQRTAHLASLLAVLDAKRADSEDYRDALGLISTKSLFRALGENFDEFCHEALGWPKGAGDRFEEDGEVWSGGRVASNANKADGTAEPAKSLDGKARKTPSTKRIASPPKDDDYITASHGQPDGEPSGKLECVNDTMPTYWVERINQAVRRSAASLVAIGQVLLAAKGKLQHGEWEAMFKSGQVKLDLSFAQRLMKVARNAALAKAANLPFLPPSTTALAKLSQVPPSAVESGIAEGRINAGMTIADAASFAADHRPEPGLQVRTDKTDKQERGSRAVEFLALVLDDRDAPPGKPSRASERTYSRKYHPNMAVFRLHPIGTVYFDGASTGGLVEKVVFVLPVDASECESDIPSPIKDKGDIPLCKPTCHFVTLAVRGNVPTPEVVPTQILEGGYKGVLNTIENMWPKKQGVVWAVRTNRGEVPSNWEPVPCGNTPAKTTAAAEPARHKGGHASRQST